VASKGFRIGLVSLAAALAGAALTAGMPEPAVEVVHERTGRVLWRIPVHDGSRVALHYVNSLVHAPTSEQFVVDGRMLRLVEVTTTAEAVMEYLRLDPPYQVRGGWLVAPTSGPVLPVLVTRIGQTGRQWLDVDGRSLPLYEVGVGEAVRIQVVRRPRAVVRFQPHRQVQKTP
jgi:hypothetical protein